MVAIPRGRREVYVLAHPALREVVLQATLADRARTGLARRTLAQRRAAGERLRLPELVTVGRSLRGTLGPDDRRTVTRSLAAVGVRVGLAVVLVVLIVVALFADSRRAYTLALDPPNAGGGARIVVRLGRRRLSFLDFMPNRPPLGSIMADTGYTAAALSRDTVARIASGGATGRLDGGGGGRHVPGWLRDVLNGLRPVPRGIAKALLGDPDGVAALKQAFADPADARRDPVDAGGDRARRRGRGRDPGRRAGGSLARDPPPGRADRRAHRSAPGRGQGRHPDGGRRARGALARGAGRRVGRRARGGAAGIGHACRPPRQRGS